MAKPKHGAVSFIVAIIAVYFVVRYWASIQSTAVGVVNAVSTSTVPTPASTLPVINMASGAPGDPAFSAAFGGSSNGFSGNLFTGPLGRANGGLGNNPGFTEGTGSVGDARVGLVPNSFGNCSTQPGDGKALCA